MQRPPWPPNSYVAIAPYNRVIAWGKTLEEAKVRAIGRGAYSVIVHAISVNPETVTVDAECAETMFRAETLHTCPRCKKTETCTCICANCAYDLYENGEELPDHNGSWPPTKRAPLQDSLVAAWRAQPEASRKAVLAELQEIAKGWADSAEEDDPRQDAKTLEAALVLLRALSV